jgi:hypothetical protein
MLLPWHLLRGSKSGPNVHSLGALYIGIGARGVPVPSFLSLRFCSRHRSSSDPSCRET